MAYDKSKMQDIKISEKNLWQQYLTLWNNNDFDGINELFNNNTQLKYKIFNAFNWNRLVNSVNDSTSETSATSDSLVGAWKVDFGELEKSSEDFKYVGVWEIGKQYKKNNLIKFDEYHSYFCISDNTASTSNSPPNIAYWLPASAILGIVGIPVTESPPENMIDGDIYFEIIN